MQVTISKKALSKIILLLILCIWFIEFYLNYQFDKTSTRIVSTQSSSSSQLPKKYNIFFIETNFTRDFFDLKQQCAIESAALNNPDANIFVYYMKGLISQELLHTYSNIKPIKINLLEIFRGTILADWWEKNGLEVLKGHYAIGHISDILRLVLLYKYGGFYSDLDTITIRSIEPLLKYNGVGYLLDVTSDSVGNGILVFSEKHPFLLKVMHDIIRNYDPTHWSGIGPRVIMRVLGKNI
jgi:lactosylceramide 4-alpha-galactosyltransferase